jgi:serine/threonine protein phosphatase PrpC
MILGSDGLWDSVSNDEAIHFVQDRLAATLPAANSLQSISHDLGTRCPSLESCSVFALTRALFPLDASSATEAYMRGSSDNIGVCIVDLAAVFRMLD